MQLEIKAPQAARKQEGSALVGVVVVMAGLASVSLAVAQLGLSARSEQRGHLARVNAQYAAEAALAASMADLNGGGDGNVFTSNSPLSLGGATAFVQVTAVSSGQRNVVASGAQGLADMGLEVVLTQQAQSVFQFAAFGDESMTLDSNAFVDSYDASAGAYLALNGTGGDAYANTEGNIGSNGDVDLDQNSTVFGDAQCGPTATTTVLGNAEVNGSTLPASATVTMPSIDVPIVPDDGTIATGTNTSTTITSGDHGYSAFSVGKNAILTIIGPATLVVDSFEVNSGSSVLIDDTGGPVEIYVRGDFIVNSNTLIASLDFEPADLSFLLESDNIIAPDVVEVDLDEVDFDSNAKIYGTILAPNAAISINSNFELFGAIAAKQLHLDSNCKIHYDESLADMSNSSENTWTTVGYRVRGAL
ncbi:DUF7305 domain-containing protein [Engelhardtia mirabilis]|uniref:DUF7305 domain-containing protein n=1 Tax=Engelhardtia mirabilis TaxID=2528011 RepID=A0A518BK06_9BACT|nr:hypothetical protein Pla133_23860 [Planctomycetes bacterium Pla133]QDV01632.1 hypothetical protein Pla86_23850 [Planctomycetes bacterium Pla86]